MINTGTVNVSNAAGRTQASMLQDSLEMNKSYFSKKMRSSKPAHTPVKDITTFVDELIGNKTLNGVNMRPYSPPSSNLIDLIDPNKSVITRKQDQTVVLDYSSKGRASAELGVDKEYTKNYVQNIVGGERDLHSDFSKMETKSNLSASEKSRKILVTDLEYDALLDCYFDPKTGTYHAKT